MSDSNKLPKVTNKTSVIRGIASSIEYFGTRSNSKNSNNINCCKNFPECAWLYREVQGNIYIKEAIESNLAKRAYSRAVMTSQQERLRMPVSAR